MHQVSRLTLIVVATLLLAACVPIPPTPGGSPAPAPAVAATAAAASTPSPAAGGSQIANPASVYCGQQGGQIVITTDSQGAQSGMCVFPDGNQCDEWAFFRGECQPAGKQTPTPVPQAAEQLVASLRNGRYELPDIGTVPLAEGVFDQRAGQDGMDIKHVEYLRSTTGDLDGDGSPDAVVTLAANTGGSGTFIYLVALLNRNGALQQSGAVLLGDRVQVKDLSVQPGGILVDLLVQGPEEGLCCPTQPVARTYRLVGSGLELVSEATATPAP